MTQVGIILALLCALATNVGFLCKHRGAAAAPAVTFRHPLRSAGALFGARWFALGFAIATAGWVLHVAAMAVAPLSLVQAVISGGLVMLAYPAEHWFGLHVGRRERTGLLLSAMGLMLLAVTAAGTWPEPRVVCVLLLLGHSAHVRRPGLAAPRVPPAGGGGASGWRLAALPSAAACGCVDRGGRSRSSCSCRRLGAVAARENSGSRVVLFAVIAAPQVIRSSRARGHLTFSTRAVWHVALVGLGYYPNPYGLEAKDGVIFKLTKEKYGVDFRLGGLLAARSGGEEGILLDLEEGPGVRDPVVSGAARGIGPRHARRRASSPSCSCRT